MIRLTDRAHEICQRFLQPGDIAVDATVGNGHDTLFLAKVVGPSGRVYGFDVQEAALEQTRQKLGQEYLSRVIFLLHSHAEMNQWIEPEHRGHMKVVMFNLGYLPGGDKAVTTHAESTLVAIEAACGLLHPEGIISVIAYPGHNAGRDETGTVTDFFRAREADGWCLEIIEAVAESETAPRLFLLSSQGGS
jgi:16S rRNA C1402 N4-methylase RsmH